jgi:hypothetical protein
MRGRGRGKAERSRTGQGRSVEINGIPAGWFLINESMVESANAGVSWLAGTLARWLDPRQS